MMNPKLNELKIEYQKGNIVPFIGAGMSMPFNIPDWGNLIYNIALEYFQSCTFLEGLISHHLEKYDFWGAIEALKEYIELSEQDIQEEIVNIIDSNRKQIDEELHNYSDFTNMNFNLFLTTNYENILDQHLGCNESPMLLKNYNSNTQNLFTKRRVMHLHGYTSDPNSIVISKEKYNELYQDNKYDNILKAITSGKKLLFLGFSFKDQFVRTLIKDHKKLFQGKHYIILSDSDSTMRKELKEEFGLTTIDYSLKGSSHVKEIRKILRYLNTTDADVETGSSLPFEKKKSKVIIGAGLDDMQKNVEDNLFYKKLGLEKIDQEMIELSSLFYIAADEYIRDLRTHGMPKKHIDILLRKVFFKYKENFVRIYKKDGDSPILLDAVHSSLEKLDLGRHESLFDDNSRADEYENKGFIHILADDSTNTKNEIWWGDKRLNVNSK